MMTGRKKAHKVSVVGAGAVGATLAMRIVESDAADVVLLDIVKNIAVGKSFDLLDAAPITGHERKLVGTDDYRLIEGSDIIVITAGFPRRPGMTREELISKNASVVTEVSRQIRAFAPAAIVIVITNPLDAMTYLARKITGFKRQRVIGMAGTLDGARFAQLVADELGISRASVRISVLGSHGDTMVPVISRARAGGRPLERLLTPEKLAGIIARTRDRGAEIVSLLGSGSAYYSPSAAAEEIMESVLNDSGRTLTVSVCLEGEYGLTDVAIGVPCRIGREGAEAVVELELSAAEREAFLNSARAVKDTIKLLEIP